MKRLIRSSPSAINSSAATPRRVSGMAAWPTTTRCISRMKVTSEMEEVTPGWRSSQRCSWYIARSTRGSFMLPAGPTRLTCSRTTPSSLRSASRVACMVGLPSR